MLKVQELYIFFILILYIMYTFPHNIYSRPFLILCPNPLFTTFSFPLIIYFRPFPLSFTLDLFRPFPLSFPLDLSPYIFTIDISPNHSLINISLSPYHFLSFKLLSFTYPLLQTNPLIVYFSLFHTLYFRPFPKSFTLVLSRPFTLDLSPYHLHCNFPFILYSCPLP